jgi:hypothetical protein
MSILDFTTAGCEFEILIRLITEKNQIESYLPMACCILHVQVFPNCVLFTVECALCLVALNTSKYDKNEMNIKKI